MNCNTTHYRANSSSVPGDPTAATFNQLEVEENVDAPGAFSLTLPVNLTSSGDYDVVNDSRLAPLSNVAIVATASDGTPQCIFDGYVLSQTAHLDTGTVASTLRVWGQDATWLMNTTEKVREWVDLTDGDVANSIFGDYGFTPDSTNMDDDSPAHTSDGATLMQRATDAQFLRFSHVATASCSVSSAPTLPASAQATSRCPRSMENRQSPSP